MADANPPSDTGNDIDAAPGPTSTDGTPRWMKAVGIGIILLVVLVVILLLSGGGLGGHGPGMHTP
jgi:hypothetical protein